MQDEVKVTQIDAAFLEAHARTCEEEGCHHLSRAFSAIAARIRLSRPSEEGLRIDAKQADVLHRAHLASMEMTHTPEAADEIASLRARVAELEAENDRLTKAVGSGILGELLNDEETDEFVNFIKFLRGQAKEPASGKV